MEYELVYGLTKAEVLAQMAKGLYHKMHPTNPIEQLEADIVARGRNW